MLVLARKVGERIMVGEGPGMVVITLIELRGNNARIGIEADDGVPVDREEIRKRKDREKEQVGDNETQA